MDDFVNVPHSNPAEAWDVWVAKLIQGLRVATEDSDYWRRVLRITDVPELAKVANLSEEDTAHLLVLKLLLRKNHE